MERKAWS
jgi:hypothetical protein